MSSTLDKALFDLSVIANHGANISSGQLDSEHCTDFVTEHFNLLHKCLHQANEHESTIKKDDL